MQTEIAAADRFNPLSPRELRGVPALLLALAIVAVAVAEPLAALGLAGGACLLVLWFYRRAWLLGGVFVGLLFQNLVYDHLLTRNPTLAAMVKNADDVLAMCFAVALVGESLLPTVRLNEVPLWRPFLVLAAFCLLSGAYNHLSAKEVGVGTYVILKNFVWFFAAASLRFDAHGYRNVLRFVLIVLGAVLAFGLFQFATGELTYNLLGLMRDYRLGILRLRSIFVHPVYLSEAMALLAVLAVGSYLYLRKPAGLFLAAGALIAVGLTMMVKIVIALGGAVGFILLRKRPWLVVPYAVAAAAALFTFSDYGAENIRRQFATYVESPESARREAFRICGEILRDSPLLGVGPGMFGGFAAKLLESQVPARYRFINYDQTEYSTLDTHWPHLAAELGLLGFLAYGGLLWAAGWKSWQGSNRADASPHFRVLAMAAAVFLLVIVIEAIAAANLEDTLCGFMAFSLLGLTQRE